jgi:hypothetical protein
MQSYYLAECLRSIERQVPVSLIGYSFGARIITGALHLLAGGEVAGRSLPKRLAQAEKGKPAEMTRRAVLVAAALDADWLLPGRRNGLALSQVNRLLITRNPCDRVLRWYPLMYGCRGPEAMGRVGPRCWCCAENVEVVNVSCAVGRAHDWASYLRAPGLRNRLADYTFADTAKPCLASGESLPHER